MSLPVPTVIIEERMLRREGLGSLLDRTPYEVIAAVATVSDLAATASGSPALVIVGFSSGMEETIEAIRKVRHLHPDAKVFIVGESSDRCEAHDLLRSGADGCILNVGSREVLIRSLDLAFLQQRIIVVGDGGPAPTPLAPPLTPRADASPDDHDGGADDGLKFHKLSDRERQILGCLARGMSNKAVARACVIAEATVKVHVKAIVRKLDVRNRTQAAIWAINNGVALHRPCEETRPRRVARDFARYVVA